MAVLLRVMVLSLTGQDLNKINKKRQFQCTKYYQQDVKIRELQIRFMLCWPLREYFFFSFFLFRASLQYLCITHDLLLSSPRLLFHHHPTSPTPHSHSKVSSCILQVWLSRDAVFFLLLSTISERSGGVMVMSLAIHGKKIISPTHPHTQTQIHTSPTHTHTYVHTTSHALHRTIHTYNKTPLFYPSIHSPPC